MPAAVHPLALAAGLLVMLATLGVGLLLNGLDPLGRRARRLARPAGRGRSAPGLLLWLAGWLAALPARLAVEQGAARERLSARLAAAGIRRREAVGRFRLAELVCPTLGALLGWLLAPALGAAPPAAGGLAVAAAAALAGAAAPEVWLRNAAARRRAWLLAQLPLALDLYVICVESGLGPDAAMARVARELGPAAPEMADELGLTALELSFLPDRHDAFRNLCTRAPLEEIRALAALFQQTERFGTPLADALRTLAHSVREQAMLRAEEKAARLPAILTVPLILFILPPLFIVLIGPAFLQLLALG